MLTLALIRPTNLFAAVLILVLLAFTSAQSAQAEEFTNFFDMKFVTVPGGTFQMGAAAKTFDVKIDELPQHNVVVPGFQMMTTEVTLAQFKRHIIESSMTNILRDEFMDANGFDDAAPVIYISWTDTSYFLHWLNENKPDSDRGEYMLPTEAEWEYACRAGTNNLYCGGETVGEVAWYSFENLAHQQPVAQKVANAFGLYDMSGNAREWVRDCYHRGYETAPGDGSREWTRDCYSSKRVIRGGSWDEVAAAARATDRLAASVNSRAPTVGFRVVRKIQR